MLIQDILLWLLGYGLFIIFSAIAINGLHITTRGDTETLPNGAKGKINDMIFYPLLQLVKKEKGTTNIYYGGDELAKLCRTLLKKMPLPPPDKIEGTFLRYNNGRGQDAVRTWQTTAIDYLDDQEIKLDTYYDSVEQYGSIRFYKEYPDYYLPKYVRKPLLDCIKCMASVWGTLIYWTLMIPVFGFHPLMIPVWIMYCFSLSWVNTFFYHKAS